MSQINPFSGYVAGSAQVQRQQAADKDRQVRRAQQLTKNVALEDDQLEHQVESAEELKPVREQRDQDQSNQQRRPPSKEKDRPRVDVKA